MTSVVLKVAFLLQGMYHLGWFSLVRDFFRLVFEFWFLWGCFVCVVFVCLFDWFFVIRTIFFPLWRGNIGNCEGFAALFWALPSLGQFDKGRVVFWAAVSSGAGLLHPESESSSNLVSAAGAPQLLPYSSFHCREKLWLAPGTSQSSDTQQYSWYTWILSLAVSHAFIPGQGTRSFPSSFFSSFPLKNSAKAVFIQMKPCHFTCVHLNTEKTLWNEITEFVLCQNTDCSYYFLWVQWFSE